VYLLFNLILELMSECVTVMVRCRPMNKKEIGNGSGTCIQIHKPQKQVEISADDGDVKNYTFDAVYADDSTQR
jgi:hypothetical protein